MAQIHWTSAISSNFNGTTFWSTGTVPGPADDAIIDAVGAAAPVDYTVTSTVSETVLSIQTNIYATLDITGGAFDATAGTNGGVNAGSILIENNTSFEIGGVFNNTGLVSMIAGNNLTALIVAAGGASLTGAGLVTLNSDGNNQIAGASAAATLTNVNNVIDGGGQIGAGQLILVNDAAGLIQATTGTQLTLNTGTAVDTNNGLLEATAGTLVLQTFTVDQSGGGTILAAYGEVVALQGADVIGGVLHTAGTGAIQVQNGVNLLDGLTSTVTNEGLVEILNNAALEIEGAIYNTGTIDFLAGNNATELTVTNNAVLSGGGQVTLNNDGNNIITASTTGVSLTNVDNVISGAGQLGDGQLQFVNDAGATVEATYGTALVVNLGGQTATNDGLFEGEGIGGLILQDSTINDSGGGAVIAVSGGYVGLQSADIVGGLVDGEAGGVVKTLDDGSQLDGTGTHPVTALGDLTVTTNTALTVIGAIDLSKALNGVTLTGTITLAGGNNATDLSAGQANATVIGGAIVMTDDPNNEITGVVTQGPSGPTAVSTLTNRSFISGAGLIGNSLRLVNDTTIEADGANALIIAPGNGAVAGSNTVTNNGLLESANPAGSSNTGGLELESAVIANALGKGVIEANGAATHVDLKSATIEGGTLKTAGGGVIQTVDGGSVLDGSAASVTNDGQVDVDNNTALTVVGGLDNVGQLDVLAGNNGTDLAIEAAGVTLTGGGQVYLSNSGNNRIYGFGTAVLLTNVDNTISGAGQFGLGTLDIVNDAQGVIDASAATALNLQAGAASVTNYGLIEATGAGGLVMLASTINDSAGGVILAATGSSVDLQSADIVGGLLETAGTGVIQTTNASSVLDGSTASVTISGLVNIQNNTALTMNGQIVNQGTILLNAGNNGTDLILGAAGVTLSGGGQLTLSNSGNNRLYDGVAGVVLTNVDNTIAGAGQIGLGSLGLVNEAKGVIDADDSTALEINAGSASVVNDGLIEATGSGGLIIQTTTINDSKGGIIEAAAGSLISLNSAHIVGGRMKSVGTGAFQTTNADSFLDGTASAVTLSGQVNILNNTALSVAGTFDNLGGINLQAGNNGTDLLVAGAGVTLTGGGQVLLSNSGNNRIYAAVAGAVLTNFNDTISGAGQLGAGGLDLINDAAGLIDADDATAIDLNVGPASVANYGLIEATGAGGLLIQSSTINDSKGGVLLAATGSAITLASADIIGGELETTGTGVFQTANSDSELDGTAQAVTLSGQLNILNNEALTLAGTLDNLGTVSVLAGNNGTDLIANNATLTDKGRILLSDDGNNIIQGETGVARLVNVNNIISGAGQLGDGGLVLINDAAGKIEATGANALVINVGSDSVSNAGLIEAIGTGGLFIESTLDNAKTGVLQAGAGSQITLQNGDIVGGTLKTVGSGFFQAAGGNNLLDGSTSAIDNLGTVDIVNNCALQLSGAIDNAGSVNIDAGNNGTVLEINTAVSLTGGGQVTMADANAIIEGSAPTAVLTNVNDVISGAGQLGAADLTLINDADGIINASGTAALTIQGSVPVTNDGMIEATGTGGLTVIGAINGAGGGEILAATNSVVTLINGTIQGGTLSRTGTGVFIADGGTNLIDGTASAVTNQAEIEVANNTVLELAGTIDNTGTIAVDAGNNGTDLLIAAATVSLTGAGQVVLTDDGNNLIYGAASADTLVNVANTISGAGQLGGGVMTLINRNAGVIDGDGGNQLTINTGGQTISNAGRIEASGSGGVAIVSAVANTGILEVNGGNLTVGAAVTGTGYALIHSGVITFDSTFAGSARFTGISGTLALGQSQTYAGKVSGFSTHGAAGTDYMDLVDIAFVGVGEATFKGTAAGGILTVTDGTHTAKIALVGNYTRSGFVASSDGIGGTLITLGKRLPVAIADSYTTMPDQALTETAATGVLANDVDPNGLTLSAILAPNGGPTHGTLVLSASGAFTYTPDAGYKGPDSFSYIARDADGSSAATTVTLIVGTGGPPVTQPSAYNDAAGQTLTVAVANGVLAGDRDINGLPLTATLAPGEGPQHGVLHLNANGSFTYTPTLGFAGTDTFEYIAGDSLSASQPTLVTITVTAGDPTTKAETYGDAAGHALTVTAANGVLADDTDPNGLSLTAALAPGGGPAHGTLTLNADGSFTYTPAVGFAGKDSFTYIASDSLASSAPTTVTLNVTAAPPTTKAETYGDAAGHALTVTAANGVLADDTDPNGLRLTAALAPGGGPAHGTLTLNADGSFTYTPTIGFAGKDSFTYIASDSLASSVPTIVTLTVTATAPTTQAGSYSDTAGKVLTVTAANGVLANDTDANGLPLTAALAPGMAPQHGSLTLNANGSFTYTPDAGFAGTDSFDYIASDSLSSSQPTLVTLTVTASPPITHPETYDAIANQTLTVDAANGVLANDTDPNGLKLTASLAPGGGPEYGTLKLNADGSFTYILNSGFGGFSGVDTFTYIASDGVAQSAPTKVTIDISNGTASVAPTNAAPNHAAVLSQYAAGLGGESAGVASSPHAAFTPAQAPLFAPASHVAVS